MKGQQVGEDAEPISLLVTVDEAARRLSIGRSHIYEQIQLGTLRSIRIGRSRRILERDLDNFVERLLPGSDSRAFDQLPKAMPVKMLPVRPGRR